MKQQIITVAVLVYSCVCVEAQVAPSVQASDTMAMLEEQANKKNETRKNGGKAYNSETYNRDTLLKDENNAKRFITNLTDRQKAVTVVANFEINGKPVLELQTEKMKAIFAIVYEYSNSRATKKELMAARKWAKMHMEIFAKKRDVAEEHFYSASMESSQIAASAQFKVYSMYWKSAQLLYALTNPNGKACYQEILELTGYAGVDIQFE